MSRARILILLLAIGSAILAVVLARGMLGQQAAPPVTVEAPAPTVPVLVAAKDIALGERLVAIAVEWRDWPRDNVAPFMITREAKPAAITEFEGRRARAAILAGEPIAESKLLSADSGSLMSSFVRQGLRAISVRISDRSAAGGFILPDDRVDIIATVRVILESGFFGGSDKVLYFTSTIIENVRVLAINRTVPPVNEPSIQKPTIAVLELDPQQAEIIARSEEQGELDLALRSLAPEDGSPSDDRPRLAAATASPNSVEVYKRGVRFQFSCNPQCDPVLGNINAPFPLVVRDNGVGQSPSNR
ncbi:Flp pilus assembly protein CpaB [Aestuariivirga sp.]|jgi:pilus assembly protein CpaB|uniref:Flp pilus assembly protein CpaB n=1 Tax=Aestuariivirga sp. TaxID=2650926 RepID=UPI00378392DA